MAGMKNEPNRPPGDRDNRAKRTQFADCGLATDLRRDACPAAGRLGPAAPIAQNEANFLPRG
jgi:hypothetical protein